MNNQTASRLPTTTAGDNHYYEQGTGGKRQLTLDFSSPSISLQVEKGSVELHQCTWEYDFIDTNPQPLMLRMLADVPFLGTVNGSTLDAGDGAWSLTFEVPECGSYEEFRLEFSKSTATTGLAAEIRLRPEQSRGRPRAAKWNLEDVDMGSTAAKPTLIIRTKRSCPTGVNNPTIEE